jgi:dTDP-4-amino-4,6-dideoxygalactose transaminase
MNEVQAAFGLLQLKYIDKAIARRKEIAETYREKLKDIPGIRFLNDLPGIKHAYSYFPILVDETKYGKSRDELYEHLKENNIFARRYFYPLISNFPTYKGLPSAAPGNLPVANEVAEKVICLPIYPDLEISDVNRIVEILKTL